MSTTALAAVLTKLAGLNVAGKAAVGLGVAVGAVGAAGGGAAVVDTVTAGTGTPVENEDAAASGVDVPPAPVVEDAVEQVAGSDEAPPVDDGASTPEEGATEEPLPTRDLSEAAAFGQGVAADARDGGVDGRDVSAAARARAELRAETRLEDRAGAGADHARAHRAGERPTDRELDRPAGAGLEVEPGASRGGQRP